MFAVFITLKLIITFGCIAYYETTKAIKVFVLTVLKMHKL